MMITIIMKQNENLEGEQTPYLWPSFLCVLSKPKQRQQNDTIFNEVKTMHS